MQSHNAWLRKAKNDLAGAKILFKEQINDLAVYHAHQCAEKALKAFLAYKMSSIQKSHDLVVITEICCRYDPSFEQMRLLVENLNPFGTLMRYPSDRADPDLKTTQNAISEAETVINFVLDKIFK
jgi:HEPN domain-containing protein